MKNLIHKRSVQISAISLGVVGMVMGIAAVAGATTYNPTSTLTGFANIATATAAPIIIAVTLSLIPLLIVFLAIRWIFGLFHTSSGGNGHDLSDYDYGDWEPSHDNYGPPDDAPYRDYMDTFAL